MGTMALLRQVNHDADWYAKGNIKEKDRALEAYIANKNLVQFFDAGKKINALRFDKLGDQFGIQYVFVGGGDEYELISDIKNTNAKFILPLDFPDAYDMEDPLLAQSVSLEDLKAWNQSPANPKILAENNIQFALTTHKLKDAKALMPNLLKAIAYGLDKTKALEALTTIPAGIIGKSSELGHLRSGAYANFLITSGDVFDKETTIYENWVTGIKDELTAMNTQDLRGSYTFNFDNTAYELEISGEIEKLKSKVKTSTKEYGSKISFSDNWMQLTFAAADSTKKDFIRVVTNVTNPKTLSGKLFYPNGNEGTFFATKQAKDAKKEDKKDNEDKDDKTPTIYPVTYPNMAYGMESYLNKKRYCLKT